MSFGQGGGDFNPPPQKKSLKSPPRLGLNPGPCQMQFNDEKVWETLKTQGLHFFHLNVKSYYLKLTNLEISQII